MWCLFGCLSPTSTASKIAASAALKAAWLQKPASEACILGRFGAVDVSAKRWTYLSESYLITLHVKIYRDRWYMIHCDTYVSIYIYISIYIYVKLWILCLFLLMWKINLVCPTLHPWPQKGSKHCSPPMWQSLTEFLLHNQVHLDVDIGNHLDSVELTLITAWTQFESVYPVQRKSFATMAS